MGVSGFFSESLVNSEGLDRFKALLLKGRPKELVTKLGRAKIKTKKKPSRLALIFTNPLSGATITGKIKKISGSGLYFTPDHLYLTRNLHPNTTLDGCSLRAGSDILEPVCRVEKNGPLMHIRFVSFPRNSRQKLKNYLLKLAVQTQAAKK
jgi:hypothetical protein